MKIISSTSGLSDIFFHNLCEIGPFKIRMHTFANFATLSFLQDLVFNWTVQPWTISDLILSFAANMAIVTFAVDTLFGLKRLSMGVHFTEMSAFSWNSLTQIVFYYPILSVMQLCLISGKPLQVGQQIFLLGSGGLGSVQFKLGHSGARQVTTPR